MLKRILCDLAIGLGMAIVDKEYFLEQKWVYKMEIQGWHVVFLDVNSRLSLSYWEIFPSDSVSKTIPIFYIQSNN